MDKQKRSARLGSASGESHFQTERSRPASRVKMGKSKNKRRRKVRAENPSRHGVWKTLLVSCAVLAVILAVLLIIFGTEPKVKHQLPTVTPPEAVEEVV